MSTEKRKWRNRLIFSAFLFLLTSSFQSTRAAEDLSSDLWVCGPERSVSFTFAGRPDHYKVWDCTCPGDSSKNRNGSNPSLQPIGGLAGCKSDSPARLTLWNPSSPPEGPGSQLCGNTSMCSGSTPDPINNPTDQCYGWHFVGEGAYSGCERNLTCAEYQGGIGIHLEYNSGASNIRACSAIPTPPLSPKFTLSNHRGGRNYTLGVYGNDFVLGEGGGVNASGTPVPFDMKLTMKPNGKLITKDLDTGSIKTNGDIAAGGTLTMSTEKNIVLNGGDLHLQAGARIIGSSLQILTGEVAVDSISKKNRPPSTPDSDPNWGTWFSSTERFTKCHLSISSVAPTNSSLVTSWGTIFLHSFGCHVSRIENIGSGSRALVRCGGYYGDTDDGTSTTSYTILSTIQLLCFQ